MGSDPTAVEDLYTKIALDNKLVTRFQVRKAAEELDVLTRDGQKSTLGEVMVRLGFLSERQHQSVINACRYREQRDFDKRFGRQCLRMELLQQDDIEKALEVQKDGYTANGKVEPLADILVQLKKLSQKKVDEVKKGIDDRDKARARAGAAGGKNAALAQSGPTPVLTASGGAAPAKPAGKGGGKDDDDELAGVDLDDVDLDDDDLDAADLDDDDLKDVDLDDPDLDAELDDDLAGVDLDEDLDEDEPRLAPADDDDESMEIDPKKLQALEEKDDGDGEDEADLAEEVSEIGSEVELDEEDLKALDKMDSGDDLVESGAAWAADAFDDRPLSQRPPSERLKQDRPAEKGEARPAARSASERAPGARPSVPSVPSAPKAPASPAAAASSRLKAPAPRSPARTEPPARRPEPELAATASSPFQSADESAPGAPPPPAPAAIPGGDVFEGDISASASRGAGATSEEVPLTASEVGRLIDTEKKPIVEESDSGETALRDRLRQSARRLEEAMAEADPKRSASPPPPPQALATGPGGAPTPPTPEAPTPAPPAPEPAAARAAEPEPRSEPRRGGRLGFKSVTMVPMSGGETSAAPPAGAPAAATTQAAAPAAPATPAAATRPASNGAALDLDDPRVRRAFDKALEAAWKVFVQELGA